MWSAAIEAILTTLRYLAPATLLTLFWGQQSFLFRLLKHIDSAFRSIVFSSEEQKEAVLQWLAEAGPVKVEHMDTVWRHGWILCGVLDAALPGACAGHPPTRMSLKHAQAIADHYLGVEPVFSRSELDLNDSLSRHQEWKLATYLDRIRQALTKLTPPVSKPTSQRTSPETSHFTLDYVAKGSGLTAAQINNKMHFKIYPTSQQALDPGEITILIRGPRDTYGMAVLPPTLGKAQLIRQKLLGLQSKQNYTENVLPITQGATYLRSYGKNDMNKTYFIPKTKYEIEIEADPRPDHLKISYEVSIEGKYEISITSRGQNIVGSPFAVTASHNIIGILERDSFCLEDGEEIDIVDVKTDRKVVLRIVDFVTEKMLLKENGTLEKISDDEVKVLMATELKKSVHDNDMINIDDKICAVIKTDCEQINKRKFNTVAHKILTMNRVCKIFNDVMIDKQKRSLKVENTFTCQRSQQDIPDIVNSTFTENNINQYMMSEKRDKFIVPESISVSLRTEKSKSLYEEDISNATIEMQSSAVDIPIEVIDLSSSESNDCTDNFVVDEQVNDDTESVDRIPISSNPFLADMREENFNTPEKDLGTFVTSEYETNNSQNEETRDSSIKIIIDTTNSTPSPMNKNPFIDTDITELERPKTPVYKIIAGDKLTRGNSVFIDPKTELPSNDELGNEFINPFFMHQHIINTDQRPMDSCQLDENFRVADFIIGAPVSLPPIIRAPSPQPDIKPMMVTNKENNTRKKNNKQENLDNVISPSVFPTAVDINTGRKENNSSVSSSFHSLESNLTDNSNASTNDNQFDAYRIQRLNTNRNVSPKKDTWDSAYVSIDDSNSSPDTNNNENILCETLSKQRFSPSDVSLGLKREELTNMGPAERELWQTCCELKDNENKIHEDMKPNRWEIKRPMFTPIIEESDRSLSSGIKDISRAEIKHDDTDPVTVAFAELNDMYQEYFPNPEMSSTTSANEDTKLQSMEVEYTIDTKDVDVNSASEQLSDVKRHAETLEGTISEVQANVTESFSVSQTLRNKETDQPTSFGYVNKDETQFGDSKYSNIVLERKKYWDEKIRLIQAKTEETTKHQRKRRVSSKQLKHNDSLTKRRGKQIIKNFLSAGDQQVKQAKSINITGKQSGAVLQDLITQEMSEKEQLQSDEKLVEKWKKYWDDKLEIEQSEIESTYLCASPKPNVRIKSPQEHNEILVNDPSELKNHLTIPTKQELPEEVFKAFETSPKRFFGTSRKQILNKIDTFLGKPSESEENLSLGDDGMRHDSGLVSSRISLFHNLSHTEELPWARRKCQSLNNISNRKDSVKSDNSEDIIIIEKVDEIDIAAESDTLKKLEETNDIVIKPNFESNPVSQDNQSLQIKRARMAQKTHDKTFDESEDDQPNILKQDEKKTSYVKSTIKDHRSSHIDKYKKDYVLRKTSISKSETDIFNKVPNEPVDDCMDKYKSCDELPKINVKSFISLYESVTKTAAESKPVKGMYRTNSIDSQKHLASISTTIDAVSKLDIKSSTPPEEVNSNNEAIPKIRAWLNRSSEIVSSDDSIERKTHTHFTDAVNKLAIRSSTPIDEIYPNCDPNKNALRTPKKQWLNESSETTTESFDIGTQPADDKDTTYLSLSDIELEIIESSPDKSFESSPERTRDPAHIEYKTRFKSAKQFFQSLEELREVKKPRKLNECELLLNNKSTESLENERPQKRVKKNIKSHSMPSSEISKIWSQLQGNEDSDSSSAKLVKISEKFNVDDLFTDVMEGKLSRQGSLRGIPHKKAVLEAFRSMENLADGKMSPYELAVTQLNDFAKENKIKNAQTYLSEYPYLPTTDPSKYHSRLDAKASGLISFKELLGKKPRRNSVPDLRLNLKFEVDL